MTEWQQEGIRSEEFAFQRGHLFYGLVDGLEERWSLVEDLPAFALEVGTAEGGSIYGAVLVEPEQVQLPNASDELLGFLENHSLSALFQFTHKLCSLAGKGSIELLNSCVAGEIIIDDFIHLSSAAATITISEVAIQPLQMAPTQLNPLPVLSHVIFDLVELADNPALVLLQYLLLLLVQLLPQRLKGKLETHEVGVEDIVEHPLAVRHLLHLQPQLALGLMQLLLFEAKHCPYTGVGLVDGQHLVSCVSSLQERFDGDALVEAVHADHAAATLQVLLLAECSDRPDQFVGQGNCEEGEIGAGRTLDLQLVLQCLLPFLRAQQLLQAERAQLVPAVQFELVPRGLLAPRTPRPFSLHSKIYYPVEAKQPRSLAHLPTLPTTEKACCLLFGLPVQKTPRRGIEPRFTDLKSVVLTVERSRNLKHPAHSWFIAQANQIIIIIIARQFYTAAANTPKRQSKTGNGAGS